MCGAWRPVQAVFQKMLEKPSSTFPRASPRTRPGGTSRTTRPPSRKRAAAASSSSRATETPAGTDVSTRGG